MVTQSVQAVADNPEKIDKRSRRERLQKRLDKLDLVRDDVVRATQALEAAWAHGSQKPDKIVAQHSGWAFDGEDQLVESNGEVISYTIEDAAAIMRQRAPGDTYHPTRREPPRLTHDGSGILNRVADDLAIRFHKLVFSVEGPPAVLCDDSC